MPPPALSFVIPVRNDATRLRRCLASIAGNGRPAGEIEIVVVDNGSTDDSAAVARFAGATVITLPGAPVAKLRNVGAQAAAGALLAFVDADHEIARDWIVAALDLLRRPDVVAAGAPYEPPPDGNWVQRTYDGLRHRRRDGTYDVDWLPSGNLIVRRTVFERVGGFDASLQTCEDVDLCRRLRASGHRIVGDPRLRSAHLGDPRSLTAVFLGELWRGRDNLRASLRRPFKYRELPSIIVPLVDLSLLAVAVLAPLARTATGAVVSIAAIVAFALLAALRMVVIVNRLATRSLADYPRAFAIALVYDLARALGLVAQPGHAVRRVR